MSGHSKWSTIKHKKGREDAKRGKIFSKLSRAITVAAREGGGNPSLNSALATAIEKARDYNMPHDGIERAIKRGTGEIEGVSYERILYEGYGPGGVAVMVEVMTDNRNRAASDMRHIFSKYGGNLGASGCVSWIFDKKGVFLIDKAEDVDEDKLLMVASDAGAEDMKVEDNHYEIITSPSDFNQVKTTLEEEKISYRSAEITMFPKDIVRPDPAEAKKVLKLMDALEDHDDVQAVYANFDIADEIIEEVAS